MELAALLECLSSPSCLLTQVTNALVLAMVLFLVASGLSLILGVLGVVNFAHGSCSHAWGLFHLHDHDDNGELRSIRHIGQHRSRHLRSGGRTGLYRARIRRSLSLPVTVDLWIHTGPGRRCQTDLGLPVPSA